jgi:hypothetical protein
MLEFYYIRAAVAVRTVLPTLSKTMCGNLIISSKLSHVHLCTYVLGLTEPYGTQWDRDYVIEYTCTLERKLCWMKIL